MTNFLAACSIVKKPTHLYYKLFKSLNFLLQPTITTNKERTVMTTDNPTANKKIALVTGALGGIGTAICLSLIHI